MSRALLSFREHEWGRSVGQKVSALFGKPHPFSSGGEDASARAPGHFAMGKHSSIESMFVYVSGAMGVLLSEIRCRSIV